MTECQCEQSGFCEPRACKVNELLWKKCQAGHGESVTRLLSGAKSSTPKGVIQPQPQVSTVGHKLREVIEAAIGRKLTCGDCLGYLTRLNAQTEHDHNAIVQYLSAQFPWPIEWRNANQDRPAAISELIEALVPK